SDTKIHREARTQFEHIPTGYIPDHLLGMERIGAIDRLAEPVPYHVADDQSAQSGLGAHPDDQIGLVTDANELDGIAVAILQPDALYSRLSRTGHCHGRPALSAKLPHRGVLLLRDHRVVEVEDFLRSAIGNHFPLVQHHRSVTQRLYGTLVMGNDQQCGAGIAKLANAFEAFVDEIGVTNASNAFASFAMPA